MRFHILWLISDSKSLSCLTVFNLTSKHCVLYESLEPHPNSKYTILNSKYLFRIPNSIFQILNLDGSPGFCSSECSYGFKFSIGQCEGNSDDSLSLTPCVTGQRKTNVLL